MLLTPRTFHRAGGFASWLHLCCCQSCPSSIQVTVSGVNATACPGWTIDVDGVYVLENQGILPVDRCDYYVCTSTVSASPTQALLWMMVRVQLTADKTQVNNAGIRMVSSGSTCPISTIDGAFNSTTGPHNFETGIPNAQFGFCGSPGVGATGGTITVATP